MRGSVWFWATSGWSCGSCRVEDFWNAMAWLTRTTWWMRAYWAWWRLWNGLILPVQHGSQPMRRGIYGDMCTLRLSATVGAFDYQRMFTEKWPSSKQEATVWSFQKTARRVRTRKSTFIIYLIGMDNSNHLTRKKAKEKDSGWVSKVISFLACSSSSKRRTLTSLESGQSALSLERLLENEIEIHDLDGTSIISSLSQSTCLESSSHKPFEYVKESSFLSEFQCVLKRILTDEEIVILRLRYGFTSGKKMTISACARALQVSRSKVERRLKRCFNRIRVSPEALRLWKEYVCQSDEIDLPWMKRRCNYLEAGSKALGNVIFYVCALRSDAHSSYFLL